MVWERIFDPGRRFSNSKLPVATVAELYENVPVAKQAAGTCFYLAMAVITAAF